MSKHRLDPTLLSSTTWLIEPAAGDSLLMAILAGNVEVEVPETPIIYNYQYGWYPDAIHPNTTAVVNFSGVIYADWSVEYAMNQLNKIKLDDNVSTVILRGSSPGGSSDAGEKFARYLESYPKPIVCFIDFGQCCSAFYMIAAACDAIVCSRDRDRVGSIGTYIPFQDYTGAYEKAGIKSRNIYAEQSTEKNEEVREAQKGNDKLLIAYATTAARNFIDFVKEKRGDKLNTSESLDPFKGRIYTATDALTMGLIDQIGSLDEAVTLVRTLTPNRLTDSQTMLGFIKMAALEALATVAPDAVSEDQINALNAELSKGGYPVMAVRASDVEAAAADRTALTTLRGELKAATDKVGTLTSEVERLGKQPGQEPTTPAAAADKGAPAAEPDTDQSIIDNLPHNRAADALTW